MGTRIKTFDATGVAPNGRLYAGDLNLIQDQYADQSNFGQTHDVGTLRVGDTSIQILKFGAAEIRASAALRTDGILRGLGGLYAGAFTTTQRDAIAAGFRPYGLVILNTTNNRYEWNIGTDASPIWQGMGSGTATGTLAARPAASSANNGTMYFATDDNGGTWYLSNGTSWVRATKGLNSVVRGTLGARPAATAVPTGNIYLATDDKGGTTYESDGATWAKAAGAVWGEVPIGTVIDWPWPVANIPTNYLACYGQAISRTAYPELAALAAAGAYPHGSGDGSTTFGMPDYRGRTGVGIDNMGGSPANRITAAISGIAGTTLGAAGGVEGVTLVTAQLPAHNHAITDPGHVHSVLHLDAGGGSQQGVQALPGYTGVYNAQFGGAFGFGMSTNPTGISIQNTGGGGVHSNTQPSIMVNKIMRVL